MTYKVRLAPHAAKGYKKLDPTIQADVRAGLDVLQRHPLAGPKIKRLKGRLGAYYRYRVGDYRIVYVIGQQEQIVYVDYIQRNFAQRNFLVRKTSRPERNQPGNRGNARWGNDPKMFERSSYS